MEYKLTEQEKKSAYDCLRESYEKAKISKAYAIKKLKIVDKKIKEYKDIIKKSLNNEDPSAEISRLQIEQLMKAKEWLIGFIEYKGALK